MERVGDLLDRLPSWMLGSERASEMYVDERVDGQGTFQYIDRVGSVSALVEPPEPIWVREVIDHQHRRFHNGF